jgi:thioredoxin 1
MNQHDVLCFSASWCKLNIKQLSKLETEFPSIKFTQLDIDVEYSLVEKYDIKAVPTMVFIKNDDVFEKVVGYQLIKPLRTLLRKFIKEE